MKVVTKDECITQGDCVVCGVKEVKGRLGKFPICYDCYSNEKGVEWVIKTSKNFLQGINEDVSDKQLEGLTKEQQARLLTELCQNHIKVKEEK